jgi:hypothetical protein
MRASSLLLLFLFSAHAFADGDCDPKGGLAFPAFFGKDGTEKPIMECGYKNAKASTACDKCKTTVDDWAKKLPDAAAKAASTDKDLTCKGTDSAAMAKNPGKVDSNLQAFQSQAAVTAAAKSTDASRSGNAGDASKQFQQCLSDIDKACKGAMLNKTDKKGAEQMQKACQDAKDTADKFADQKNQDGKKAGDMGSMMDALGKAMQAAQQMAQQQQPQDNSGATSPTPESGATSPTPTVSGNGAETSKMDDGKSSTPVTGGVIGFTTPKPDTPSVAAPGGSVTGFGSSLPRSLASNEFGGGTGASSPLPGNVGGGGGGAGGGAGGGTLGSKTDGAAAAAPSADNANPYEINGGGGLRGGSFKASKDAGGDTGALSADGLTPGADAASKLDALSDKPPEEAAADDVLAHDGDSIFLRIRQKYSLLKGAGRL